MFVPPTSWSMQSFLPVRILRSELADGLPGADRGLRMHYVELMQISRCWKVKLPMGIILSSIGISRAIVFRTRPFGMVCFVSSMSISLVIYRIVAVRPATLFL